MFKHKSGEYCGVRSYDVELEVVERFGSFYLIANCPCCGNQTDFLWPDKSKQEILRVNNQIVGNSNCSQCGWVWVYLYPQDSQRIISGQLQPSIGLKLIVKILGVESSP